MLSKNIGVFEKTGRVCIKNFTRALSYVGQDAVSLISTGKPYDGDAEERAAMEEYLKQHTHTYM